MKATKFTQEQKMAFGAKLYQARTDRGWTQTDMANNTGLSRWSISQWEIGNGFPSIQYMNVLTHKLGVNVREWVITQTPEPKVLVKEIRVEKSTMANGSLPDLVRGVVQTSIRKEAKHGFAS